MSDHLENLHLDSKIYVISSIKSCNPISSPKHHIWNVHENADVALSIAQGRQRVQSEFLKNTEKDISTFLIYDVFVDEVSDSIFQRSPNPGQHG
jgi:hypothetical protein